MDRLFLKLLRKVIRRGNLQITTASGSTLVVGDGSGTPVVIRFGTYAAEWGVLIDPELKLGEAYVEGGLVVERGSIADLLAIVLDQPYAGRLPHWARIQWLGRYLGRRLKQF
ncbi:MAG: SAM-dependent methyltransferase, partial [Xanthobacteraceae bacterium]